MRFAFSNLTNDLTNHEQEVLHHDANLLRERAAAH